MQINQIEGDNRKWGNGNTTTFDIIKIERTNRKKTVSLSKPSLIAFASTTLLATVILFC
jgi:hypothetical protein